jgi:diguanylate cyclase (GGDEF)-like protein
MLVCSVFPLRQARERVYVKLRARLAERLLPALVAGCAHHDASEHMAGRPAQSARPLLNATAAAHLAAAYTDSLTGVLNGRRFAALLNELAGQARQWRPYAVALVDVVDMKRINDAHGHAVGDTVLVEVARCLQASVRRTDTVARLGGDEFALLMPQTTRAVERDLISRITAALRASDVAKQLGLSISVCVGVADSSEGVAEEVLRAADSAMYKTRARVKAGRSPR